MMLAWSESCLAWVVSAALDSFWFRMLIVFHSATKIVHCPQLLRSYFETQQTAVKEVTKQSWRQSYGENVAWTVFIGIHGSSNPSEQSHSTHVQPTLLRHARQWQAIHQKLDQAVEFPDLCQAPKAAQVPETEHVVAFRNLLCIDFVVLAGTSKLLFRVAHIEPTWKNRRL
jgi:hypothetical protein